MADCAHVTLKRQYSGSFHWYVCPECQQKFKAEKWDGTMKVVSPSEPIPPK